MKKEKIKEKYVKYGLTPDDVFTGPTVDTAERLGIKNQTKPFIDAKIKQAKELLRWKDELTKIYEKHTGQPLDKLKDDMERDKFMTPNEAVLYGLADKIVTSREEDNKEE